MAITIQQLLATLAVDAVNARVVADRFALILRDPQPDETGIAAGSTVYLRVVDLDGSPGVPSTIDFRVEIDTGSGWVEAFDGVAPVAPWDAARALYAESTGSDPYCWKEVALDHAPLVFASEQNVRVHVELVIGDGGWGHAAWGHFPWGHTPSTPILADVYYDFTTADTVAPALLAAVAVGPRTVRVTFDDSMATGSGMVTDVAAWLTPYGFVCLNVDPSPGVGIVCTGVEVMPLTGDRTFDLTLDRPMTPGCLYSVTAAPTVTDEAGNAIAGATAAFVGYTPAQPARRAFDYWRQMLPLKNRIEDATDDLRRFSNSIQEVLDLLLVQTDHWLDAFDIDLCTDADVDAILVDLGNPFGWSELDLTPMQRRKLARVLVDLYQLKGTDVGIENAILRLLGIGATVVDFAAGGWVLGIDALGEGVPPQIRAGVAEPYNFPTLPAALVLAQSGVATTFTFAASDFYDPTVATAAELVRALNDAGRWLAGPGLPTVRPPRAFVDVIGTAARGGSGVAAPFALSGGEQMVGTVQGVPFAVTFHASDFATPGATTADEVAARIELDVPELHAYADMGTLWIETRHEGADAALAWTDGTACAAVGIALGTTWVGSDEPRVTIYDTDVGVDVELEIVGGSALAVLDLTTATVLGSGGCILAPSEAFTLYSFDINTDRVLTSTEELLVRRIADYMKPAHTHLIHIGQPVAAPPTGWTLGIDALDVDTDLTE